MKAIVQHVSFVSPQFCDFGTTVYEIDFCCVSVIVIPCFGFLTAGSEESVEENVTILFIFAFFLFICFLRVDCLKNYNFILMHFCLMYVRYCI